MDASNNPPLKRHKHKNIHRHKSGLPPGTPVYTGDKKNQPVNITRIVYNETQLDEKHYPKPEMAELQPDSECITWLNINGLHRELAVERIAVAYHLHSLVLEDILNVYQIPKAEEYTDTDQIYITMNEFYLDDTGKLERDQISFVLGSNYILTFQEEEGDYFETIRERLRSAKGKLRKRSSDYLMYVMIDAVVDSYFIILDHYAVLLDTIETAIFDKKQSNHLEHIHHFNKDLIYLRRSIAPLKEILFKLLKEDVILISAETKIYLRDVLDHVNQVISQIDVDREYLADLVQTNTANMNAHLNQIIKVLTLISTIFIPLTFLVGVYGMNFDNIPLMQKPYGYAVVWGVMLLVSIIQLIIFKRKKWL